MEIKHPQFNWKAIYKESSICGPAQLWIGDRQILSFAHCQYDDLEDRNMTLDKKRFYRKGGARIHFASGHFPNGNAITQTARFAGNACRITTDIKWCAGNTLKNTFEVQSFVLPGKWQKFMTVPAMTWSDIPASGEIDLHDITALLFQDENGYQLEAGLGNDLWRWSNGLLLNNTADSWKLTFEANKIIVNHFVASNKTQEPLSPEPRFYRFESYFAWNSPQLFENKQLPTDEILEFDTECWESRNIQKNFRSAVRKLADSTATGMTVIAGMTPTFCNYGPHCNHKADTRHWDLTTIIDTASWARQALGNERNIFIKQPADWERLPSMQGLGLPNGFSNDEEIRNQ